MTRPFLLATFSNFAYFTAIGALIPTLPRYVDGPLGGGDVAVGFVMGSFAFSAVLLRPYSGRLGDTRGRRLLIVGGGFLAAASIVGYVWADTISMMIVLRIASGVGEAFFYVGVASVINDLAPDERRGEALSYFSLALFGGLAVGPVVGEWMLDITNGFDGTWILAAGFAALSGVIGLFVPETRPEAEDGAGGSGPLEGWKRWAHPAAIVPGAVLAASIWGLATFTSFTPLYALALGMSGSKAVFAFHSIVVLAIRSVGARIPDILGPARSARAALAFSGTGLLVVGVWGSVPGLFVGTFIYTIGHALAFPALMTMAIKNAPASERGAVVGTFTAFFDLSFGVGAMSAGTIANEVGYRGAFIGAALVAGIGLTGLLLRARARARTGQAEASVGA